MVFNKNKVITIVITIIGVLFLVIPLVCDSYTHYLQDSLYKSAQEQTISCRAKLALAVIDNPHNLQIGQRLEKYLDVSCGTLPKFDDFSYQSQSGILTIYNWLAQKITFIPL